MTADLKCSTCGKPMPQTAVPAEKAWCGECSAKIEGFRDSLSSNEKPWFDLYVSYNESIPRNMWELMCWAASMQEKSK